MADGVARPNDADAQRSPVPALAVSAWRPALAPQVSAFPLDDDLVLHDARSGEVFVLNHTAAQICVLCDGSNIIATMAQALSAGFGLPYREALADVEGFIAELRQADLLTHT